MVLLMIILGILTSVFLIIGAYKEITDWDGGGFAAIGILFGIFFVPLLFLTMNAQLSNETLTGYVYSKDSKWGVTKYHIRFSETAGEDVQPSFCATTGTQNAKEIDAVVGTGKKVTVDIPSTGIYFTNDLWHCASDAKLTKVEQ